MLLAVDVGNTKVDAALYSGDRFIKKFVFPGDIYRYRKIIEDVVIVSVAPGALRRVLRFLKRNCRGQYNVAVVGRDIKVPLRSKYNDREIGQDRLVTAYAAARIYGKPVLIIDFGTAVTFDIVSKRNVYMGGLILPGIKMSLESLHNRTALLPEIVLKRARGFTGTNTEDAINNGIIYGYSAICEGLIKKFRKKFRDLKVVATGGNSRLISGYTPFIKHVDEILALKGLSLLSDDHRSSAG